MQAQSTSFRVWFSERVGAAPQHERTFSDATEAIHFITRGNRGLRENHAKRYAWGARWYVQPIL